MKTSFWKALEALGASGSALFNWKHHLGGDWDVCAPLLKATGRMAFCVIDPKQPKRKLSVVVDGEVDFVALDEDDPGFPPIPFLARDIAEFSPEWTSIARALAPLLGFDYGAWETEGQMRRIGSLQDKFGHVRPVFLFLPSGYLGDYAGLIRSLALQSDSTVLFPSGRWFTAEIEALRNHNRLEFVDVAERLTRIEADPASRVTLPAAAGNRQANAGSAVRAVIHAGNGLAWNQVSIEVSANRTILLKAPDQEGKYVFSPNSQLQPDHAIGMLMRLAVDGQWRNPSLAAPDYYRVSKAFLRLRQLLQRLVPLPGDPFKKLRGVFVPSFQVSLHRDLRA